MSLEKNTSHRTGGCSTENARRKKTCSVFLPPRCSLSIAFYVPQRPEPMLRIFLLRHKQLFSKIHGVSSNKNTTHRTGACSTENARRKKTCSVFLFSRRSTKTVLCNNSLVEFYSFPEKRNKKNVAEVRFLRSIEGDRKTVFVEKIQSAQRARRAFSAKHKSGSLRQFFSRILLFPGKKKQKKRSRGSLFA